ASAKQDSNSAFLLVSRENLHISILYVTPERMYDSRYAHTDIHIRIGLSDSGYGRSRDDKFKGSLEEIS
ncbi:hypothetical protein PENTCL1PPCAC_1582, partial [Pristionchus entomophagus]